VSSHDQKADLERQKQRLLEHAEEQGRRDVTAIIDLGSGMNCRKPAPHSAGDCPPFCRSMQIGRSCPSVAASRRSPRVFSPSPRLSASIPPLMQCMIRVDQILAELL